jgi:hypothetical protein
VKSLKPKNPLVWIKYKFLEWRWDRALKRSGCSSWEIYFRINDPDYYAPGYTVRDQLFGYPYIALVDYNKLSVRFDPLFGPIEHCEEMVEWCNKNCRGKYRTHWERVIMDHEGQYLPNGIGGTDELFFGFKNERDYLLFTLRWT